jgi:hypothetical protein
VRGVNPPKESKNGSVARWLAGGEEMVKGGYFALAWLLIAGGERERERSWSLTSATVGRRLTGAVKMRRAPEPLFSIDDGWASVGNLKLARPK